LTIFEKIFFFLALKEKEKEKEVNNPLGSF